MLTTQIVMLRRVCSSLPSLRPLLAAGRRGYADGFVTSDPVVFKKFIGVADNLGNHENARSALQLALNELLDALKALPESSDYRRAVEATAKYRLEVLQQNSSDLAVEEVLDSHIEEVILECKEELTLVPMMAGAAGGVFGGTGRRLTAMGGRRGAGRGWLAAHWGCMSSDACGPRAMCRPW